MKVLLIDDHALFRDGVAILLDRLEAGVSVIQAASSEEALSCLGQDGAVDLVLMDLGLPGMSGIDAIPLLRERYPGLPIVVLSSSDDKATVLRALDQGAMGFIPKTSSADVMIGALRLVLAKGVYLPPSVFLGEKLDMPAAAGARLHAVPGAGLATTPEVLGITERQADVLFRILQGKSTKVIARELGLSLATVKSHTSAVLRALNVTTRTQAVIAASALGLRFAGREATMMARGALGSGLRRSE